jgi:hypothetical protein
VAPQHLLFGTVLVVILVGMSLFFIVQQLRALGRLQRADDLPPEDRRYFHNQAWRRLICSTLMIVLAALLALAIFQLEEPAQRLVDQGQAARARGEEAPAMDPEQWRFFDFYRSYWIVLLLVLLVIIGLAAADFFAIRRYGQRHYRRIQEDRRAMIEGQLARLRSQRNGHS